MGSSHSHPTEYETCIKFFGENEHLFDANTADLIDALRIKGVLDRYGYGREKNDPSAIEDQNRVCKLIKRVMNKCAKKNSRKHIRG